MTEAAGLGDIQLGGDPSVDDLIDTIGSGAGWLDYDGDGDHDLYVARGSTLKSPGTAPGDSLYRNDGDDDGDGVVTFTDVTEAAGLGDTRWSFGVAVADYDGDGDDDLYLTNWGANRLYRNDGGVFNDVARVSGVDDDGWGASAAWSDPDRDGDLDLYVANYVVFSPGRYPKRGAPAQEGGAVWKGIEVPYGPRGMEPAPDVFYRNDGDVDGDGTVDFVDATASAGLDVEPQYALGVVFLDADGDGDDDLYVANDSVRNSFFLNQGDGTFVEDALFAGLAYNEEGREQAGMGVDAGDYDRDGRPDLAVTNFSHDHDTLYRNEGGGLFTDVSYPAGIGTPSFLTLGWGMQFLDADHDGWLDLYVAHGHIYPQVDGAEIGTTFRQRDSLFLNRRDGSFRDATVDGGPGLQRIASSRSASAADVDGDGDLDLFVTVINDTPSLLRNDGAPGNWLVVDLEGAGRNTDGIGARVSLRTGGATLVRQARRNVSYLASVPPQVHFGIGDAESFESIEVVWPSGKKSVVEGGPANRMVTVSEPRD